jgi:hypothetical protein
MKISKEFKIPQSSPSLASASKDSSSAQDSKDKHNFCKSRLPFDVSLQLLLKARTVLQAAKCMAVAVPPIRTASSAKNSMSTVASAAASLASKMVSERRDALKTLVQLFHWCCYNSYYNFVTRMLSVSWWKVRRVITLVIEPLGSIKQLGKCTRLKYQRRTTFRL